MTLPQAELLWEEHIYQQPTFQLMDFVHRMVAQGKPLYPPRVEAAEDTQERVEPTLIDALLRSAAGRAVLEEKGCVLPSGDGPASVTRKR